MVAALKSPLRVQYATGRGECYGYDEFGRDQAEEKRDVSQEGFKSPYVKQGASSPLGIRGTGMMESVEATLPRQGSTSPIREGLWQRM